eukprot:377831-Rhodomonas_salina.6
MPVLNPGYNTTRIRSFIRTLSTVLLVSSAIVLRACYAMSGTEIAYVAIGLRPCYAMSGTGIAYGAIGLRACCSVSGSVLLTGLWPSTRYRYEIPAISLRVCNAMSGTELGTRRGSAAIAACGQLPA